MAVREFAITKVKDKGSCSSSPAGAHAEIAELGSLIGGVPAPHDAIKLLRPFVWRVTREPCRPDEPAALRRGHLLVLAGEIMLADPRGKPIAPGGRYPPDKSGGKPVGEAKDLRAGFVPETSGQVARRHVDDQPPDTAVAHRRQFRGDKLVMPARREWGARVAGPAFLEAGCEQAMR
jgi:hypothetical protein